MVILLLADGMGTGGAESHVATLAKTLRRLGHFPVVASAGGAMESDLIRAGVVCLHFPAPLTGRALPRNARWLSELVARWQFDVLHAHTRRTAFLLRFLRGCRPATVVTAHALFSPRLRRLSFWGDRTIAVGTDLRDHLVRAFGCDPESVRVIPNGIDEAVFSPGKGAPEGVFHLVFASRLDADCSAAAWDILSLTPRWRAVAAAVGLRLTVTLIGGGEQAALLREAADTADGTLTLPGAVTQAEMANILRTGTLFVGVSRAAMEALFCGCAVVLAGDEGFGGRLTEENFDRLLAGNFCCRGESALTVAALDEAVTAAIREPASARRDGAAALGSRLRAVADAEHMTAETVRVYREAIARRA